jgi:uncharacterized cysteine cluster protein YcgN (CxxCxxCC family)
LAGGVFDVHGVCVLQCVVDTERERLAYTQRVCEWVSVVVCRCRLSRSRYLTSQRYMPFLVLFNA